MRGFLATAFGLTIVAAAACGNDMGDVDEECNATTDCEPSLLCVKLGASDPKTCQLDCTTCGSAPCVTANSGEKICRKK